MPNGGGGLHQEETRQLWEQVRDMQKYNAQLINKLSEVEYENRALHVRVEALKTALKELQE
jgi:hypothetical protein